MKYIPELENKKISLLIAWESYFTRKFKMWVPSAIKNPLKSKMLAFNWCSFLNKKRVDELTKSSHTNFSENVLYPGVEYNN